MLISLPVNVNNKSTNILFQVTNNTNEFIITPYNNNNLLQHIILYNKLYGINVIPLYFPLILYKNNNILISDMHFIFYTMSSNDDFCTILVNGINNFYKTNYHLFNNINNIMTIKLNHMNDNNEYTCVDDMMNKIFYRTNKYLNFCLAIMAIDNNHNISSNSKISHIINSIKQIKVNYYGNNMTVEEHLEHIKNKKLIRKKRYYFFTNDNKILKLYVNTISENIINCSSKDSKILDESPNISLDKNNYNISAYPLKFIEFISVKNLISSLILSYYKELITLVSNIIYKNKNFTKLINMIYENDNDNMIYLLEIKTIKDIEAKYNDYLTPIPNNISFNKFTELIKLNNNFDIKILEKLFSFYTYPFSYDKRTLNQHFAKILYYSFTYYNNIIEDDNLKKDIVFINTKIKSSYIFVIKVYKSIIENDLYFLYNNRIYTDTTLNILVKILLFNDTFNLMDKISLNKTQNIFIDCTIILNILNNITWKSISKQLASFKYIVDMKYQYGDLFITDNKINKNINMDYKLKKLIIDPLHMFNYLKKESDYYKWIKNFKNIISKIFYNPIILTDKDYYKLSKIIFLISKITSQSLENTEYKNLINYLQKNSNIILYNDRINIRIKDIFVNNNLNFGYLAKHINDENNMSSITLIDDSNTDEVYSANDILSFKLNKITQKYFKYKGKYIEKKKNELL